jgi:Na+-translocating ferredoxin:NAD+ oxidoreductase RnfC subunit
MRSLAFTSTGQDYWNQWAANCCSCGLCTLFSCPEALFPKEACDQSKAEMREAGIKWTGPAPATPHPMRDGRRVPIKTLTKRLQVQDYDVHASVLSEVLQPKRVVVPLKQGAGVANKAIVKNGDKVKIGQPLGEIPANSLGAIVHAPFSGEVKAVTEASVIIERES